MTDQSIVRRAVTGIFRTVKTRLERKWSPPTSIATTPDEFVVSLRLGNVRPKDLAIAVNRGRLTVSGSIPTAGTVSEAKAGHFRREYLLPRDADPARLRTALRDDTLEVRIPRREANTPLA